MAAAWRTKPGGTGPSVTILATQVCAEVTLERLLPSGLSAATSGEDWTPKGYLHEEVRFRDGLDHGGIGYALEDTVFVIVRGTSHFVGSVRGVFG